MLVPSGLLKVKAIRNGCLFLCSTIVESETCWLDEPVCSFSVLTNAFYKMREIGPMIINRSI